MLDRALQNGDAKANADGVDPDWNRFRSEASASAVWGHVIASSLLASQLTRGFSAPQTAGNRPYQINRSLLDAGARGGARRSPSSPSPAAERPLPRWRRSRPCRFLPRRRDNVIDLPFAASAGRLEQGPRQAAEKTPNSNGGRPRRASCPGEERLRQRSLETSGHHASSSFVKHGVRHQETLQKNWAGRAPQNCWIKAQASGGTQLALCPGSFAVG